VRLQGRLPLQLWIARAEPSSARLNYGQPCYKVEADGCRAKTAELISRATVVV
jgi:hypothetical protein